MSSRHTWSTTTHDWSVDVDRDHLSRIRARPDEYAPGGVLHLILEVLAYAVDEAEHQGGGRATVTVSADCTIEVSDYGRGTDTRRYEHGIPTTELTSTAPTGTTGTTIRFRPDPSLVSDCPWDANAVRAAIGSHEFFTVTVM